MHFLATAAAFAALSRPAGAADPEPPRRTEHVPEIALPRDRPLEWELDLLDGPRFRLSDYRGKAVFLNIFATWCGPCVEEQPSIVAFALAHADDTAVIGVNVDELDDDVRRYRRKFAIPYPIALDRRARVVPNIFHDLQLRFPTTIVLTPNLYLAEAGIDVRPREWFEAQRRAVLDSAGEAKAPPSR